LALPQRRGQGRFFLTTQHNHTQSVIIEISEAIGSPLDHFHLRMEPFGDSIVFCKPPHPGDLLFPRVQRFCQRLERLNRYLAQIQMTEEDSNPVEESQAAKTKGIL
jgi:hypothetical protein